MKININQMLEDASQNVADAIKIAALALNFRHHFPEEAFCEAYYWLHWWKKTLNQSMPPEGDLLLAQFDEICKTILKDVEFIFEQMDHITELAKEASAMMDEEEAAETEETMVDEKKLQQTNILLDMAFAISANNKYVS